MAAVRQEVARACREANRDVSSVTLIAVTKTFDAPAIQPVIDAVDRINLTGQDGVRRVRIHGVGFPVILEMTTQAGNTGERFAALMRALCAKNGGTFVGLNTVRP